MAIQDAAFDLEEMFLGDLQDLPFWGYFDDTSDIQIVVIRTHTIVRMRNHGFKQPKLTIEVFTAPTMADETFTTYSHNETFMDAT